jgi:hypothetical protein
MQTIQRNFTSTLSNQDMKKHIPYSVEIPTGTQSLQMRLAYYPHLVNRITNLLTLTVFDPAGFRGAAHRHGNVLDVTIEENNATPGFFPGIIQPGNWIIQVDTHMIMPGEPLQFELTIEVSDNPIFPVPPIWKTQLLQNETRNQRRAGWYRGDLHAHTHHSDGSWGVEGLIAFARANQLDFVTLSDHNTVTGLTELEKACPPDLLPIFGSELTTFWGHALALGRREWVDWRIEPGKREMANIATEIEAQNGLFIIAHPEAVGDPYCTGCHWEYDDVRPGAMRVVEVWNSPWDSESNNEDGLKLAYEWVQKGLRMVFTAGTDRHGEPYGAPESAFNMVYAENLSTDGILKAIRAGHLYLSNGPVLMFTAQAGEYSLMTGDSCQVRAGEKITATAQWENCPPGSRVTLLVDGRINSVMKAADSSSSTWSLSGGDTAWAQICLRTAEGTMLAMSNPIYFDGR